MKRAWLLSLLLASGCGEPDKPYDPNAYRKDTHHKLPEFVLDMGAAKPGERVEGTRPGHIRIITTKDGLVTPSAFEVSTCGKCHTQGDFTLTPRSDGRIGIEYEADK